MEHEKAVKILLANALCHIYDEFVCDMCPAANYGEKDCDTSYFNNKKLKEASLVISKELLNK